MQVLVHTDITDICTHTYTCTHIHILTFHSRMRSNAYIVEVKEKIKL